MRGLMTVFDWLFGITRNSGPGGIESEDRVQLALD
jgi:hypothetical protein